MTRLGPSPASDDDGPTEVSPTGTVAHPWAAPAVDPDPASSAVVVAPGTIVGNYRVVEPLANGGMGVVFLGEHIHLGRRVAIKFLHPRFVHDPFAVARFFAEAVAAARISHPGAVSVFDYGAYEGGAYLVMEYLRGETLSARLERQNRLPIARVLDIGIQLALIVGAAHEAGVIHRDLKPDNVHLVPDPSSSGYEYVKVIDFGVAKLTRQPCSPHTQRGDLLGTPLYMAPEQCRHAGTVDPRCDVYSLGCLLYQVVTGIVPFRGSLVEILIAHQSQSPEPPSRYDPEIPRALEALILRMLAKSPDHRPRSMTEVVRALSGIQTQRRVRATSDAIERERPTGRSAWFGLFVGVGLVVAGLGHLATLW